MSVRIVKTRNLRTKHHLKRSNTIKYHRYLATLSNTLLNSVMPGNDLSVFNIFTYFAFLQQLGGRACGAYKPKTHKPAVVGLKRALSAKQSISKRSRYPLNFVSVYLLIGDLEHLMGTPVFFLLEHVRTIRKGSLFFLLKLFFDGQFF